MSKFLDVLLLAGALAASGSLAHADGNPVAGERLFGKCRACHTIGEGARHRAGPQLNGLIGRVAGTQPDFRYSPAMIAAGEAGLTWSHETLAAYIVNPKGLVKGNAMAFGGIKNKNDVENLIAYLKTFNIDGSTVTREQAVVRPPIGAPTIAEGARSTGPMKIGRVATAEEIAAWDIDVRPDGHGLPEGSGTVAEGEALFTDNCAVCHGDFGEGVGRWPVLAGGQDSLTADRPVKTIGSYWPYLSTVYDYVRRAMPFGNARSLSDDDIYALTAYLLYLNDVVADEEFELSDKNFTDIHLGNEANFIEDNRLSEPHYAQKDVPCMTDCKPGPVKITARAQVLDVTPETADDENAGAGSVD